MLATGERERGASAVEFALIASLLFMLVFGIINFGIAYNRVQGLQAGAREGARVGSLSSSTVQNIIDRVVNSLSATVSAPAQGPGAPFSAPPAMNNGYVWVSRRSLSGTVVTYNSSQLSTKPCDAGAGVTTGDTIVVDLSFRTEIQLPPIMTFPITLTTSGQFLCEGA